MPKATECLQALAQKKKATLLELQSVIGLLNFACRVIIPGRAFLRRLIDLTKGLSKPRHHVRLNSDARRDLRAWLYFLQHYNGISILRKQIWVQSDNIRLYSDAASTAGYAAILGGRWFNGIFPSSWNKYHITLLELYPIVAAVELWGHLLANHCIVLNTDNEAVVFIINSQTSKDSHIMCLVRRFVICCMQYNILFKANHIPGKQNVVADYLSRLQVARARTTAPWLREAGEILPQLLLPTNILSTIF